MRHDFFPGDTRQSLLDSMQKAMTDKVADDLGRPRSVDRRRDQDARSSW